MIIKDCSTATDAEFQARIAAFEGADAAPETFDAIAALRRVEALCDVADDQPDGYECRFVATDVIRAALAPQTGQHTADEETDRG